MLTDNIPGPSNSGASQPSGASSSATMADASQYQELTTPSTSLGFEDSVDAEQDESGYHLLEQQRRVGGRWFAKELRCLLYGFGDDENPYTETVELLEDLLIEFITETTHKCMEIGRLGRVQVEDIVFLLRKDPKKFSRVRELLTMNEELKKARKAFDEQNF